jgi:hypothetical protein
MTSVGGGWRTGLQAGISTMFVLGWASWEPIALVFVLDSLRAYCDGVRTSWRALTGFLLRCQETAMIMANK